MTNDKTAYDEQEDQAQMFWLEETKLYRFGEANQTLETAIELKLAIDNLEGECDAKGRRYVRW